MFGGAMKKESKSTKDTGHSFADYFKRALNPLLVLLLLSEQPMYVYEMMREISKRSDGRYTISLLYPVIQRLLSQGGMCAKAKKRFQTITVSASITKSLPMGYRICDR